MKKFTNNLRFLSPKYQQFAIILFCWLIWLSSTILWWQLKERPTTVEVIIHFSQLNVTGVADLISDPWSFPPNTPSHIHSLRYPIKNVEQKQIRVPVQAPIGLLQFRFARQKKQSLVISKIELNHNKKSVSIPASDLLDWECLDCSTELILIDSDQQAVKLTALSNKPLLTRRDFHQYTDDLDLKYHQQRPLLRKFALLSVGLSSITFMLVATIFVLEKKYSMLAAAFFISTIVCSGLVYWKYNFLIDLFSQPMATSIIAFAQFNGFPIYADSALYFSPLALVVLCGLAIKIWKSFSGKKA